MIDEILEMVAPTTEDTTPVSEGEWRVRVLPSSNQILDLDNDVIIAENLQHNIATQIVREHNTHRKLVEALQAARNTVDATHGKAELLAQIDAALVLAEEERR